MKKPIEMFGEELLEKLGEGPRRPFYHTEGKSPLPEEEIDYMNFCYRGTENGKPVYPLEIDITIQQFNENQSLLDDLNTINEREREIFLKEKKYLWIIDEHYELRMLPEITQNPHGDRGHVCHTNISAGNPARHGGELWFGKDKIIFVNNSSGRFFTENNDEWLAVVEIFLKAGYEKVIDIDLYKNDKPVIHE